MRFLACCALLPLLAFSALAQDKNRKGGGMEEFESVDPYTKGERKRMKKLGYVNFGTILWNTGLRTDQIEETMGGMPILWVETPHFKIGSSLTTYKLSGGERIEGKLIKDEINQLKKSFGSPRIRPPKHSLDPWLRLHLFAQRAEQLYADFHATLGLEAADYEDIGPILGQKNKFLLLICERKSEMVRYLKGHLEVESEQNFRWSFMDDCLLFAINAESFEGGWGDEPVPTQALLNTYVIAGLSLNMVEGYRNSHSAAPTWFKIGLSHFFARQYDPRWVTGALNPHELSPEDELWKWDERVLSLVKKKFFASSIDMFKWQAFEELSSRDHMIAWSRVQYLLSTDGDHEGFLQALCTPLPTASTDPEGELAERQTNAVATYYQLTPEELDKKWVAWVKKTYR